MINAVISLCFFCLPCFLQKIILLQQLKTKLLLLNAVLLLSVAAAQTEKTNEIQRFSKALQFETISDYDSTIFNPVVYKNFITYLQQAFPLTHQKLEFKIINEYSLVYYWKGTDIKKAPILFLAHYDVVPAEASTLNQWTHPPFSGYIDNEWIWGRGAIDNKFQVMSLLETTEKLLKENFTPRQDIYFAFGHDEEIGGEQGASKIAEYLKTKNLEFDLVLDEGGIMVKDIFPGITKTIAFISTAEKGDMNIEMAVFAKGGHSSVPPKETAIDILSKAIIKLNKHPMPPRLQEPTIEMLNILAPHFDGKTRFAIKHRRLFRKKILKKLNDNTGTNALIRTVISTTMLHGGSKENSLPTFAAANLNIRIPQADTIESVMQYIHKITDDPRIQLTLKRLCHNPSPITPSNGRAWQVLSNTIKENWPDMIISPLVVPGTTDSRHYSSLSKNIFRFIPVTVNNESKEQIHGINERISLNEYRKAILFYTELIKKIGTEF
jgi:carboxypeptidase PM20D1